MPWKANGPGCPCCNTCSPTGSHCVTVRGCNSGGVGSGATVTLKVGATTIDTCTTDSSSQCCLDIAESRSDYTLEVSPPSGMHFQTYSVGSQSIACGSTSRTVTLTPSTGYTCYAACFLDPIVNSATLTVTDSIWGATTTAVSSPHGSVPAGIYYKLVITYNGCDDSPGCVDSGATVSLYYRFTCTSIGGGYVDIYWKGANGISGVENGCPVDDAVTLFTAWYSQRFSLSSYTENPFMLAYDYGSNVWPLWCSANPSITVDWS